MPNLLLSAFTYTLNDPTNLQTRYNFYEGILIIIISCRICRDSRSKLKKTTRTTWINSSEKRPDLGVIQDNQTKYNFELNCWSDSYKRTFYLKTNLCLHKFKLIGQPWVIACLDCVIIGTAFSLTVNQFTCPEHEPYLREFIHLWLLAECLKRCSYPSFLWISHVTDLDIHVKFIHGWTYIFSP